MRRKRADRPRRQMCRDCARLMAGPIAVSFLECLLTIAAPTVISILLGDMADALLALDTEAIAGQFPAFLLAVCVQVLLIPLTSLAKNMLLTRQGTAYDMFLMNSTLQMPHKSLHSIDAGDYIYRFEADRTLYYLTIVRLYSYPPAILAYGVLFAILVTRNGYSPLFCLWILALSAVSILYDSIIAGRQARLQKETADYEARRTQLEQEAFSLRDFSLGFGLGRFLIQRLNRQFEQYWAKSGKERAGKTAASSVIQFLCDYGVQVVVVLVGAILVLRGSLEVGALLGGYLMIPTIKKGWEFVKQIIQDLPSESKYGTRMEYFYQEREPREPQKAPDGEPVVQALRLEDVCFSYQADIPDVVSHMTLDLDAAENIQLEGPNGCGKSTLLSLIGGVYPPESGRILDGDGIPVPIQALRRSVALQEQDSVVFTGTVWENLFLPDSAREDAEQLLKELAFDKPLDYLIQGDGKNLSPGERKKVLLTRALLKNAPFLALDEPLNHLDRQSQEALVRRLERRGGGVILVSHQGLTEDELPLRRLTMEAGRLMREDTAQ